ncbi:hypothetical protein [Planomicrobium okeanokoites]|uniref:hypothetical protein n=1 Tax=Planomicrobium okeanokoites TaxID=244 RepID=UPI00249229F2|nr:hypothetical protein [Planomicrobium okeanokoites]
MYKTTKGYIQQYHPFSNFDNVAEFNKHIEMFLASCKSEFTKSEFIAFRRLTKYCVKVAGVATASVRNLLRAIQDKDWPNGISESTFHRMRRKAVKLGILKVIERKHAGKNNSSNIWVFQKYEPKKLEIDTPHQCERKSGNMDKVSAIKERGDRKQLTPHKAIKIFKTSNNNKRKGKGVLMNKPKERSVGRQSKSRVPQALHAILSAYFDDTKYIGEFWRMAQHFVRKKGVALEKDVLVGLAINSFTSVKRYMKDGTAKKPIAIYNTIFESNLQKLLAKRIDPGYSETPETEEELNLAAIRNKLESRMKENDFLLGRPIL